MDYRESPGLSVHRPCLDCVQGCIWSNRRPSHDDITYQSIAKAFDLPLVVHQETFERMKKLSRRREGDPPFDWSKDSPALHAKLRMVKLPTDTTRPLDKQVVFTKDDLWVPVSVVNGNVHILPGIPRLCMCLPPAYLPAAPPDGGRNR